METSWGVVHSSWPVHFPPTARYSVPRSSFVWHIQCTCSSVKGPVAILDAAYLSVPPSLRIYSSLLQDDSIHNQPNYGGVPHVLLDYLVATSLLLVTDIEEYLQWRGQDPGAAKSAIEAFLPPALRNARNGRRSCVSTESRSPANSNENVSSSNHNTSLIDDARSFVSEVPSTPSSTISQSHPYSFYHLAALDPDVPPVPEVPPELQAYVPPILPRSSMLPLLPTPGRSPTVRRRLPQPPTPVTPARTEQTEQPWSLSGTHSTPNLTQDFPYSSSIPQPLPTPPQHLQHQRRMNEFTRSSMSINRRQLPPQRQPPQLPIPIPPKLRDDLARSLPPSATSSGEMLSSTNETPGQVDDPGSTIHEGDNAEGLRSGQPQEFHRRLSGMDNPPTMRASVYELPPPAYDAIDFSLTRPPSLSGEGYSSFSVNSRLHPEQIS